MWIDELNDLALLPRAQQYSALRQLRKNFTESHDEQWNTAFGPTSLYEAWTQLPLMQGLYQRNRAVIQETLQGRSDWHIVEIGGGNGALWQGLLNTQRAGTLTLIDPHAEAHDAVAARLPGNVTFRPIVASAEHVEIPDADVIVCSLTLHHVAGLDSAQRRSFGLEGTERQKYCGAVSRQSRGVTVRACLMRPTATTSSTSLPAIRCSLITSSTSMCVVPHARSHMHQNTQVSTRSAARRGKRSFVTGASIKSTTPSCLENSVTFTSWTRCIGLISSTRRARNR